jgi:hypothetical protein
MNLYLGGQVAGDKNDDIFDGPAVELAQAPQICYVPAEKVARI